jgi:hypothetical protein
VHPAGGGVPGWEGGTRPGNARLRASGPLPACLPLKNRIPPGSMPPAPSLFPHFCLSHPDSPLHS